MKKLKKTILSTADVARLFNVTETTVKRWADDGTLKCQKTPGGHRKFLMKHVAEFSTSHQYEPIGALELSKDRDESHRVEMAILSRDYGILKEVFIERALSPDQTDLFMYFSYLYQHHLQLWEIHDFILGPGMSDIGDRWMRGEIGISHEHRASYEVLDALAKLQAQVLIREPAGLSVICACLEDELHEIGLRCASYLFESEGWRVHYLGARTPHESLVAAIRELHPAVVCISVTNAGKNGKLRNGLTLVVDAARQSEAGIVLGGQGASQQFAESVGCNGVITTSRDLVAMIRDFPRPGNPSGTVSHA